MSPVDKEIIRRKITIIIENLRALEVIKDMAIAEYADDIYKRKATERLMQELIEAAIDINIISLFRQVTWFRMITMIVLLR